MGNVVGPWAWCLLREEDDQSGITFPREIEEIQTGRECESMKNASTLAEMSSKSPSDIISATALVLATPNVVKKRAFPPIGLLIRTKGKKKKV